MNNIFHAEYTLGSRRLAVEYYYDRKAPGETTFQNWFTLDGHRIEFPDRNVLQAIVVEEHDLIVRTTRVENDPKGNVFCFDLNGRQLWQVEKPRFPDDRPIEGLYHLLPPLTRHGRLVLHIIEAYPPRFRDDGGGIEYEVDLNTGRILLIKARS